MAFDVNTITLQGAIAVASATTGNKLVIDGCDATTDVLTQAQAAQIVNRPATPGSTTSEIALAGSTDNHVFAYAEFLQGQSTGGDFNSFFLYGHMEDDSSTVFVISVCSSTAPVHVPASGDVTNRTEVQFDLTFTPNAEVVKVADTSMYCTRGEFLILKERAVTTHAEGTPTTGEAQNIYGAKTFKTSIISNTIKPESGAGVLGNTTDYFNYIYGNSLYVNNISELTSSGSVAFTNGLKTDAITAYTSNGNIALNSSLLPPTSSMPNIDLGGQSNYLNYVYSVRVYTDGVYSQRTGNRLILGGSDGVDINKVYALTNFEVQVRDSNQETDKRRLSLYLGYVMGPYIQLKTTDANGDTTGWEFSQQKIVPVSAGTYSIGSSTYPINDLYVTNYHGTLPNASSSNNAPEIGCIMLVKFTVSASGSYFPGQDIKTGTGNVSAITVSNPDGTQTNLIPSLDNYTFRMLSYCYFSGSGSDVALVMRIQ